MKVQRNNGMSGKSSAKGRAGRTGASGATSPWIEGFLEKHLSNFEFNLEIIFVQWL